MFNIFIMFVALVASAETYKIKDSHLEFVATGKPAMMKIVGESNDLSGSIEKTNKIGFEGSIVLNLKTLKTGIELRDEHMKNKYLEVEKYPNATLKVQGIPELSDEKELKKKVSLPLTLHGVEKSVDVDLEIKNSKDNYAGTAEFTIKLSDFNITIPSYLGIKVADKVDVKVKFKGTK